MEAYTSSISHSSMSGCDSVWSQEYPILLQLVESSIVHPSKMVVQINVGDVVEGEDEGEDESDEAPCSALPAAYTLPILLPVRIPELVDKIPSG